MCHAIGPAPICLESQAAKRDSHPHDPFRRRRGCHELAAGAGGRCGLAKAATEVREGGKPEREAEGPKPLHAERSRSSG